MATPRRKSPMTKNETLTLQAAEIRFAGDEDEGQVTAASPYGVVDSYRTIFAPGAFRSAAGRRIPMLMGHDPNNVLGSWSVEDAEGALQLRGRMNLEVQRSREVRALVQAGDLPGVSVGFRTAKDRRLPGGIREITEAELMEVSFVTFPAVPGAAVTDIRSSAPAEEVAAFLRAVRRAAVSFGAR